jgi:diamine N-acetyltransferase
MDAPTLRRATAADAETLAVLGLLTFRQTFLEGFAIPYPPEDLAAFEASTYAPAAFAGKLADPRQATWLVERGREALAYANAGPCTLPHPDVASDDLELSRLYVRRDAQGQALGRGLLEVALAWMEGQAPGPLWIGVWSGNLKAQRLYAGYGFVKAGEYEFPVGRWRDREFILRRP